MKNESLAVEACRCRIAVAGDIIRTCTARKRFKSDRTYQDSLNATIGVNEAIRQRALDILGGLA